MLTVVSNHFDDLIYICSRIFTSCSDDLHPNSFSSKEAYFTFSSNKSKSEMKSSFNLRGKLSQIETAWQIVKLNSYLLYCEQDYCQDLSDNSRGKSSKQAARQDLRIELIQSHTIRNVTNCFHFFRNMSASSSSSNKKAKNTKTSDQTTPGATATDSGKNQKKSHRMSPMGTEQGNDPKKPKEDRVLSDIDSEDDRWLQEERNREREARSKDEALAQELNNTLTITLRCKQTAKASIYFWARFSIQMEKGIQ